MLVAVALALILRDEPPERPRAATLADYWAGNARWELAAKWTGTQLGQPDPYSGAHMEVVGGRWYLFDRGHRPGTCPDGEPRAGVQVRESTDRGATWSPPVMVIEPAAGTPWSCAATDGDAYYDAARSTWRYLFQCKEDGGVWNGCYAERAAESPMGPFSAPAANPVIRSGDLWGAICDPGDGCARQPVREEGTFDIFRHDDSGYWISFHGSDGTHGYRGVAKTTDFVHFVADRPEEGLAADAILDQDDADAFRETWEGGRSIGAGAGRIVVEDGHFYALNEFADISLRCTDGQNWDLGLFRSASPASTAWEPFPGGNPIVASSRAPESGGRSPGCNVPYPSLFRDPATGTWYLMHGRTTSDAEHRAIFVYRLVRDGNLLVNGDFATLGAHGWTTPPGAAVNRLPNTSADGTPYLAFACDAAPCVSQDVPIDRDLPGRDFSFGGTFRAEAGGGSLRLTIHQLDGERRPLHEDAVEASAGAAYGRVQGSGTIRPGARVLRYSLRAEGPSQLAADDLFLTLAP